MPAKEKKKLTPKSKKTAKGKKTVKRSRAKRVSETKNDDAKFIDEEKIVEIAVSILSLQITSATGEGDEECQDRLLEYYALGYMFGFCGGVLAAFDKKVEKEQVSILTRIYCRLFGEDGGDLLEESLELQDNELFRKGGEFGWKELQEAMRDRQPPMGLAGFLKDENRIGNEAGKTEK